MGFKVVQLFDIAGAPDYTDVLTKAGHELAKIACQTEDEIIAAAQDADVLFCLSSLQPISRRVIEGLKRCRLIQSGGIGYDKLDVAAATDNVVLAANIPDYCIEEVSDHAMALLLAVGRRVVELDRAVKAGRWLSVGGPGPIQSEIWPKIVRLQGKTLGLVGLGRIARAVAQRAQGFGMRAIACDPYIPQDVARGLNVKLVDLDTLLRESDFISLHTPLTAESHHLIDAAALSKMKPGAGLINTSRGGVVDEQALLKALKDGKLAGAALDVTDPEPVEASSPLLQMDNVIITAHSGHYSPTAWVELWNRFPEEAIRLANGEWPRGLLNPEIKEKYLKRWAQG